MPSSDIEKALFQTALRYLGYRDRFSKEIELRLKKQISSKKLPPESLNLIPNILAKLEKSGLINDQELIKSYINSKRDKLGPHAISHRLFRLGAPKNLTDSLLAQTLSKEDQGRVIEKLIKKAKPNLEDAKNIEKLQRFLIYRGFDMGQIREKIALIRKKE